MTTPFTFSPARIFVITLLGLLLGGRPQVHAQGGSAARPSVRLSANSSAPSSSRADTRNSGKISFAVQKTGSGRPMIFIPGLYCSGDVWKEAVRHFSTHFTCYTLTLPGFAGQPPLTDPSDSILLTLADQLADYIRQEQLQKPVIVGHSLGGWLALAFGVRHPELAGDLVIVSSAPFLPTLAMGPEISVDSASRIGLLIKKGINGQTPALVKQYQKYTLATMITDSARIPAVIDMAVRSDQPTQGEVMYELFSEDLRPLMGRIRCKVLVLADWSAYKQYGASRESVQENLLGQYKLAGPGLVTISINDVTKHFIMFDQPDWMYGQMDSFLAGK
jgi:N-formylmaleamate deformylase